LTIRATIPGLFFGATRNLEQLDQELGAIGDLGNIEIDVNEMEESEIECEEPEPSTIAPVSPEPEYSTGESSSEPDAKKSRPDPLLLSPSPEE